jgi:hypothetical protein
MNKRVSQRKLRQERRLAPEAVALRAMRELELPSWVEGIEDELQGEWNQLCVFVQVSETATQAQIEKLAKRFAECFQRALPRTPESLSWSVSFWQAGVPIHSVMG